MRRLRTTPLGRRGLTPEDKAEIEAGPTLAHIGFARGYTCRLFADWGQSPLVEVYRAASAIGAYRAAVRALPEVIHWRDTDVEVVA